MWRIAIDERRRHPDPAAHGQWIARLITNVYMNPTVPSGNFAISPTGTLAYVPLTFDKDVARALIAIAPDGTKRTLGDVRRSFTGLRVSPDGTRLVVTTAAIRGKAWTLDLARGVLTGLTSDEYEIGRAIWTPDDEQIVVSASMGTEPQTTRTRVSRPMAGGSWADRS